MAVNEEKIGLGLGVLEIGSYVNGVFQAYRNVGAIKATLTITWTREINKFTTGRPLRTVKSEATTEMFTLTATLAEVSVANLRDALSLPGALSESVVPSFLTGNAVAPTGDIFTDSVQAVGVSDIVKFGGQCDLSVVALRFTHPKSCSAGTRQIVEVFRAQTTGQLALPYNETEWNQYEVTWEALIDQSRPAGEQYMQFIDERE